MKAREGGSCQESPFFCFLAIADEHQQRMAARFVITMSLALHEGIHMNKSSRIAMLLVLSLMTCAIADSPAGDEPGFVSIFNGKDTQGWIYGSRRGRLRKFGKGYQVQ